MLTKPLSLFDKFSCSRQWLVVSSWYLFSSGYSLQTWNSQQGISKFVSRHEEYCQMDRNLESRHLYLCEDRFGERNCRQEKNIEFMKMGSALPK